MKKDPTIQLPNMPKIRGRPAKADAMTNAERQAAFRAKRKEAHKCPCCGQKLPEAT